MDGDSCIYIAPVFAQHENEEFQEVRCAHTVYGCSLITKAEKASNCGDLVVRLSAESDSEETLKLFYGVFA